MNIILLEQNIFSIKMQYHRLPLANRQNQYKRCMQQLRPIYREQTACISQKQNTLKGQNDYLNKIKITKDDYHYSNYDNKINLTSDRNPKHTKSDMIYDCDIEQNKMDSQAMLKSARNEQSAKRRNEKGQYQDQKKYNAKHMQIQSKLNKIQSYHQKIQSLLQIVNIRSRTPIKNIEKSQTSLNPSRSLSKISTPISKGQYQMRGKVQTSELQFQKEQRRIPGQRQSYSKKGQGDDYIGYQDENYKNRRGSQRKNKYSANDSQNQTRSKSKQYMKSIEGEVKDIQNTIQQLNHKIKQTDTFSFRKQINFEDLTSSKPYSLIHQKLKSQSNLDKSASRYNNHYEASIQTYEQKRMTRHQREKIQQTKRNKKYQYQPQIIDMPSYERKQSHQSYYQFQEGNAKTKRTGTIYKHQI